MMGDEKNYCLIYRELCEWAVDSHCDQQNYCVKREQKIREEEPSEENPDSEEDYDALADEQDEEED